jgi:hypothetical protein
MRKYFFLFVVLCPLIIFSYTTKEGSNLTVYDRIANNLRYELTAEDKAYIRDALKQAMYERKQAKKKAGDEDWQELSWTDTTCFEWGIEGKFRKRDAEEASNAHRAEMGLPPRATTEGALPQSQPSIDNLAQIALKKAILRGEYRYKSFYDINAQGLTYNEYSALQSQAKKEPSTLKRDIIGLLRIAIPYGFVVGFPLIITLLFVGGTKVVGANVKAVYRLGKYMKDNPAGGADPAGGDSSMEERDIERHRKVLEARNRK